MTRVNWIRSGFLFLDVYVWWLSILVIIFDVGLTFYYINILMNVIKVAYSTNAAN